MSSPGRPGISESVAGWVAAGLIVGLGFILRVNCAVTLPPFNDEAMYLSWVKRMLSGGMTPFVWMQQTGKSPLFELWVLPFGVIIPDILVAGRTAAITAYVMSAWGCVPCPVEIPRSSSETCLLTQSLMRLQPPAGS